MMVHLVSLVVLESLVDLVPKVNKTLTSHLFMTNSILRLCPSTDSCVCASGFPGDSYGYPGGPGAKGLVGESGYPGETHPTMIKHPPGQVMISRLLVPLRRICDLSD